jgi:hypothetical protein
MSSTQSNETNPGDDTARTAETVAAELDAAKLARASATGHIKANMTRAIKALEHELAALTADAEQSGQPDPEPVDAPMNLADLEADIIAAINGGTIRNDRDAAADYGDTVLRTRGIRYYRPERWDEGRWLSAAMLKRIQRATKAEEPEAAEEPQPTEEPQAA